LSCCQSSCLHVSWTPPWMVTPPGKPGWEAAVQDQGGLWGLTWGSLVAEWESISTEHQDELIKAGVAYRAYRDWEISITRGFLAVLGTDVDLDGSNAVWVESFRLEKTAKIIQSHHQPMPVAALDHVPLCHIHPFLEHLQWQWLHHLPVQPVSPPQHSSWEEIFPNIERDRGFQEHPTRKWLKAAANHYRYNGIIILEG